MKFVSLFAFAVLAITAVYGADEEHKCHESEMWNDCASMCEENCLTRGFLVPCVKSCYAGCVCQPGYTRRGWDSMGGKGSCVASTMCDSLIRAARGGH